MIGLNKDKKDTPILEFSVLTAVVIAFLFFIFQIKTGDINLARSVFNGLVGGRYNVEKYIDWERLQGLTINAGAAYSKFTTQQEKTGYKKAFIQSFSKSFKQVGGKFRSFVNWRIDAKDNNQIIIAADYQGRNKILLFTFSGGVRKRLTSIQWKE